MPSPALPVVFVHGLWLHATSWGPWLDLFREAGYEPFAPGWPGALPTVEESRLNPESLAGHGVDDAVGHFAKFIGTLEAKPIIIGHSFGGTIAEKLLGQNAGVAAVAIDAAPIKGVLPLPISSLRAAFPVPKNPANKDRDVSLIAEQFR